MGARRVQGGKRLRWRVAANGWVLMYDGRATATVEQVEGMGAQVKLVPHPLLGSIPYSHWFPSLAEAKSVAAAAVQYGLERAIHGLR